MVLPQISLVSLRPTNTALSENASSIPSCRKEQEINVQLQSLWYSIFSARGMFCLIQNLERYIILQSAYEKPPSLLGQENTRR